MGTSARLGKLFPPNLASAAIETIAAQLYQVYKLISSILKTVKYASLAAKPRLEIGSLRFVYSNADLVSKRDADSSPSRGLRFPDEKKVIISL